MSHEEDYATNIDEQLLSAVKNQVTEHDLGQHIIKAKLEQHDRIAEPSHNHNHGHTSQERAHEVNVQVHQVNEQVHHTHDHINDHAHDHINDHSHDHINDHVHDQVNDHVHGQVNEQVHDQASYQQHMHDVGESEYNIQIPEPIVNARSRIFPVNENTITHEGNLITRPFPEQLFHGRQELDEFISEFARDNGFGVVIAHSNKKAIYYTCELGGRYRIRKGITVEDDDAAVAEAVLQVQMHGNRRGLESQYKRTKKLRCPFAMTASYRRGTMTWLLRTTCNEHNHPQLDPLMNHPMLRKRTDELNAAILELYKLGTKPSHIESKIRQQYPDQLIKREDIYNEVRGYKRKVKKEVMTFPSDTIDTNSTTFTAARVQKASLEGNEDEEGALAYELERHRQEVQLERELRANELLARHPGFNAHSHSHSHHTHLDEQQLQHYQQQLSAHGLHDSDHSENTAAAAIAAVANATHADGALSIDNIDSRLVGE